MDFLLNRSIKPAKEEKMIKLFPFFSFFFLFELPGFTKKRKTWRCRLNLAKNSKFGISSRVHTWRLLITNSDGQGDFITFMLSGLCGRPVWFTRVKYVKTVCAFPAMHAWLEISHVKHYISIRGKCILSIMASFRQSAAGKKGRNGKPLTNQ